MRAILSAAIVALAACSGLAQSDTIVREGSGERREALNALELTPFDTSLLGGLSEWTGRAVTASEIDGKPVLILTWASWHTGSTASARAAELMAKTFADKGLVVLGVHSDEGYDTAAQSAEPMRLSFPIARDLDTKFRAGIKADMDPNFYVIDRAGQLRFADITRESVREALTIVTNETREEAAAAKARRAGSTQPALRVIAGMADHDVAKIPEWNIPPQDVLLYQDTTWPKRWPAAEEAFQAEYDRRGEEELPIVNFNSELLTWVTPKPELNGRIRVVYFWAHTVPQSYERVQPLMDEIQKKYGRDVAVIGVAIPWIRLNQEESRRSAVVDEEIEKFGATLQNLVKRTQVKHSIAFDKQVEILTSSQGREVRGGGQQTLDALRELKFPIVVLYSTDNSVRWVGHPLDDHFDWALNRMVEADPQVKLRRQRDEAYLARQRQGER